MTFRGIFRCGVTMMTWLEIVRFELVYQLTRRSNWVIFAVFLFPVFGTVNGMLLEARGGEGLFNGPLFLAQRISVLTVIALLVIATVGSDAATRDVQTRMEPLMHASPIGRASYLGGRVIGAFLVCALLLVVVPLVMMVASLLVETELVGPFRPPVYLQSYFLLILPNAFVATAMLFALATLGRHMLGSYAGALLLVAGTAFGGFYAGPSLGRWDLAKALDPMGLAAINYMTRTWSPVELNERLIGSDPALLWNRLLWLVLAFAVLAFTDSRFREGGTLDGTRWWPRARQAAARPGLAAETVCTEGFAGGPVIARHAPVIVPRVARHFGSAGRVRQTLAIVRDSWREIATPWTGLALLFVLVQILAGLQALEFRGIPLLPTTGRVLGVFDHVLNPTVLVFAALLAGELVDVTDASPQTD